LQRASRADRENQTTLTICACKTQVSLTFVRTDRRLLEQRTASS
jgi:hypothetical protein